MGTMVFSVFIPSRDQRSCSSTPAIAAQIPRYAWRLLVYSVIKSIKSFADLHNSSESPEGDLLSLQWPAPPRNILVVKKDGAPSVTGSLVELVKYDTA